MKVKTAHLIISFLFAIMVFGCADDGSSDAADQSTDNILSTDSDTNPATGTDSGTAVNDTNNLDTASGQLPGDTSQISDSGVSTDSGTDSATVVDTADTGDTAVTLDTATGTGPGHDSDSTVDTGVVDTASDLPDTGVDSGISTDTGVDTAIIPDTADESTDTAVDTAPDTANDTDADTDSDSTVDTDESDCPFVCRSENWCATNDGIVSEVFTCAEANQVCCEFVSDDTETETEPDTALDTDTETADEVTCTVGCHSASWCHSNDATVYDDQSCTGNQVCCEVVEEE